MDLPKNIAGRPPREHFLDANADAVRRTYLLPANSDLHYVGTTIYAGNQPLSDAVNIQSQDVPRLLNQWKRLREKSEARLGHYTASKNTIEDLFDLFNTHFDIEALYLDDAVNSRRIDAITQKAHKTDNAKEASLRLFYPSDCRTFMEESVAIRISRLGNILENNIQRSFFDRYTCEWYHAAGLTRYSIGQILNTPGAILDILDRDIPLYQQKTRCENADSCYAWLKELRFEQIARRGRRDTILSRLAEKAPRDIAYLTFVGEAMRYNEDSRLRRSPIMYEVMTGCVRHGLDPSAFFLKAVEQRKGRSL